MKRKVQVVNKVWSKGLIRKLEAMLPKQYVQLLEMNKTDRFYQVKQEGEYSELQQPKEGVLQGRVLGYNYYSAKPEMINVKITMGLTQQQEQKMQIKQLKSYIKPLTNSVDELKSICT